MKNAFTMLEIIMVIVIVGILAVVIIPRTGSNKLAEAAVQLIADIRYTQHLAMVDDSYSSNDNEWFRKRWQIVFSSSDNNADNRPAYLIFKDNNGDGTVNKSELARNTLSPEKYLSGGLITNATMNITNLATFEGTRRLNLGLEYGITRVTVARTCSTGTKIAFDHIGRPIRGPLGSFITAYPNNRLISAQCTIRLDSNEGSIIIAIEPETGYAHIL